MKDALRVSLDLTRDEVTIEGVVYSGEFFRGFARDIPLNEWFCITQRGEYDGRTVVSINRAPGAKAA